MGFLFNKLHVAKQQDALLSLSPFVDVKLSD